MSLKMIITASLLLCVFSVSAQEIKSQTDLGTKEIKAAPQNKTKNEVFRAVQQKAYPTVDLGAFFSKNLRYTKAAKKANVAGRVTLEAVVEKDGSLSNIRVVRGLELGHGLPEEATRVLKTTPKWNPAIADGKAVRSYYIIPVSFNL